DVNKAWVIGNHGIECIDSRGQSKVDARVEPYGPDVDAAADALTTRLGDVRGIIVENKHWTLSVHYRLVDRALVPRVEREAKEVAQQHALRCFVGKQVI